MNHSATRVDQAGRPLPDIGLSEQAIDLYGRLTTGEQPRPGDAAALAELQVWGMAGRAEDGDRVVPLPPTTAACTLAQDALVHFAEQARLMRDLPDTVHRLETMFASTRFRSGSGAEFLADRDEVNERIGGILAGAQQELLGAHPNGGRSREQMELGIPRDTAALARGVKYRTLYRDAVRDDAVTCEWASTMGPRGAHFRTLADPFERIIIVDRKTAVIPNYVIPDAPDGAAWIITSLPMVGYCVHAFEQEWRRATVWHGERRVRGLASVGGLLTDLHKAILRGIAAGDSLERVARGLDMKVRSVQRKLDEVRGLWNLPNAPLPVLTYHWAMSPEHDDGVDLEQAA